MTILLVSGNGPPVIDGVGHYTARLAAHLAADRPDWRWVWLRRKRRWFSPPVARAGRVTVVQPWHTWGRPGLRLAEAVVRQLRPDVVHIQEQTHSFHESAAAARIAAAAPGLVVTTVHEVHPELAGYRWTREVVQRSDVVLTCDAWTGWKCEAHLGRPADRVLWSPANVVPPPPDWRVVRRPGLVVTFGFLNTAKGLDELFAGLSAARARVPNLRWRIVGPFDPVRVPHHAALAGRLRADWVEFAGSRPDLDGRELRTWIGEASAMALPFVDGASVRRTTLQTAWAFGLPLLTTPPPPGEHEVRPGENCLAVQLDNSAGWAEAIRRVLTDPGTADRLAAGSRAAGEAHRWDRLVAAHLDLYDVVLASGGGRGYERGRLPAGEIPSGDPQVDDVPDLPDGQLGLARGVR